MGNVRYLTRGSKRKTSEKGNYSTFLLPENSVLENRCLFYWTNLNSIRFEISPYEVTDGYFKVYDGFQLLFTPLSHRSNYVH